MSTFTWKPIYSELATALPAWRNRQTELITIQLAAKEQGVPVSTLKDEGKSGTESAKNSDTRRVQDWGWEEWEEWEGWEGWVGGWDVRHAASVTLRREAIEGSLIAILAFARGSGGLT